jgi:hypothetical protein
MNLSKDWLSWCVAAIVLILVFVLDPIWVASIVLLYFILLFILIVVAKR